MGTDQDHGARRTVVAIGNYGNRNLGDEATLASVIGNLPRHWPGVRVLALSFDPADTTARHGIGALPVDPGIGAPPEAAPAPDEPPAPDGEPPGRLRGRVKRLVAGSPAAHDALRAGYRGARVARRVLREPPFLVRSLRAMRGVDVLLVSGGGYEDIARGAWNLPYRVLRWCVLARAAGARVAFVGVGVGPLETATGRRFLGRALSLARYRSYRDPRSRTEAGALGPFGGDPVHPDLAYGVRPFPAGTPAGGPGGGDGPALVGVNLIPYRHPSYWPHADRGAYDEYVSVAAGFLAWLVRRGHRVLLFPTQLRADPVVIADVRRALAGEGVDPGDPRVAVASPSGLDDLLGVLAGCDLVVAARFHGALLALLCGRPTLALADHFKVTELMAAAGLGDATVPLAGVTRDDLTEAFARLAEHGEEAGAGARAAREAMAAATERHYAELVRAVAG